MGKASPINRGIGGKLKSARAKIGGICSQLMSRWKTSGMTPAIAKGLGECRARARLLNRAKDQRNAGREGMAANLERRSQSQYVTQKDRLARAQELRAKRAEKRAGGRPTPATQQAAPIRPSTALLAKGLGTNRRLSRENRVRKTGMGSLESENLDARISRTSQMVKLMASGQPMQGGVTMRPDVVRRTTERLDRLMRRRVGQVAAEERAAGVQARASNAALSVTVPKTASLREQAAAARAKRNQAPSERAAKLASSKVVRDQRRAESERLRRDTKPGSPIRMEAAMRLRAFRSGNVKHSAAVAGGVVSKYDGYDYVSRRRVAAGDGVAIRGSDGSWTAMTPKSLAVTERLGLAAVLRKQRNALRAKRARTAR